MEFSEVNGQETAFFPTSFPRSNSLAAPNRDIGAIGNEFETCDSRDDQYNTSYCEEGADHTLETQSLNFYSNCPHYLTIMCKSKSQINQKLSIFL